MLEGQDQKGDGKSDMEVENDEEPKEDKDDKDEVEAPRMMALGGGQRWQEGKSLKMIMDKMLW